jgi:hypothetical protein
LTLDSLLLFYPRSSPQASNAKAAKLLAEEFHHSITRFFCHHERRFFVFLTTVELAPLFLASTHFLGLYRPWIAVIGTKDPAQAVATTADSAAPTITFFGEQLPHWVVSHPPRQFATPSQHTTTGRHDQ